MANLGQNKVWDDLKSKPSNASESVMGPSYSYADNIQGPASMGVGDRGTISQLTTNVGGITNYVKYMVSGPALGNRFFINTGGTCSAPDGSVQSRYNYVNNVSNAANLLPKQMKQDMSGIASNFNGLIPGMLGDIANINPMYLFKSMAADSQPKCDCYRCEVSGGSESRFLNLDLTPDFDADLCKKVDPSKCIPAKEGFSNYNDNTPLLLAAALAIIVFMNRKYLLK